VEPSRKVDMPGKGFVQGCSSSPDGRIFVARWSTVIEVDQSMVATIYAGEPSVYESVMGHRLKVARFHNIHTLAALRDRLLVYDYGASILTQIEGDEVSHVAGSGTRGKEDGPKEKASFDYIWGIAVTPSGHVLMSDRDNHKIRVISPDGMVSSIGNGEAMDTDGPALNSSFSSPFGLAVAPDGSIYVGGYSSSVLRLISPDLQSLTTVEGVKPSKPEGIVSDADGNIYICEYDSNTILHYDPATRTSTRLPRKVKSPRGVCIPKKGFLFVSENVDKKAGNLIRMDKGSIMPFHPFIYNMSLLKGSNFDFIGFEAVSPYRCAVPPSDEFKINMRLEPPQYSDPIPEGLAPCDSCLLPGLSEPLSYHQDILSLLPTKITLSEALNGLIGDEKAFELPKLLMRFLYQCGHSIDLSDVHTAHHLDVYALLAIAVLRLGFSSFHLQNQISKKILEISKKPNEFATPLLLRLLVLFASKGGTVLDTTSIDRICDYLAQPNREFQKFADEPGSQFSSILSTDPGLYKILCERISREMTSVVSLWGPRGEKRNSDAASSPTGPIPEIFESMSHSLTELAGNLDWEPFKEQGTAQTTADLESSHLWLIRIQGHSNVLKVHDWALYSRWNYFRRMLDSGMGETATRTLELPSDFAPLALLQFMRYLYDMTSLPNELPLQSARYLKQVSEEYELVNHEGIPSHGFCMLLSSLDLTLRSS
jgi:hypothetical protein